MEHTYIIGEIGQNHNGSVDIAKLIVDMVTRPIHEDYFGADLPRLDAIKLTKRDLTEELTTSQMMQSYTSIHSFGRTYGEHREALELSDEEHFEIYKYAKEKNLDFIETLCSKGCLSLLKLFTPDFLKVASRDLTNLPLLEVMAETKIPIILSTGMASEQELDEALEIIEKHHSNISILHCVSQYPTEPQNLNLNSITYLKRHYPKYKIGFSDHTIGIAAASCSIMLGAEIVEKHITIDRKMKGTDQAGSLAPDGVMRMVRDIRLAELWGGREDLFIEDSVKGSKEKLERSIATAIDIRSGEVITEKMLCLLSPGTGLRWREKDKIIGKKAKKDILKSELILLDEVE